MAVYRPDTPASRGEPGGPKRFIEKQDEIDYSVSNTGYQDLRNLYPIKDVSTDGPIPDDVPKDLIKFNIKVIDPVNPNNAELLIFRAYLDDISDGYSAGYNSFKYNGRAEKFHVYNEFDRKISFNFRIQAQSRQEMKPLHQKLNYLVAQTAPQYSPQGRMRAKYSRLTIGDWVNEVPGFFTSVDLKWKGSYSWEVDAEGAAGQDGDQMNQLPHNLDVSCAFTPIHDFAPENSKNTPFILPHRGVNEGQKWI
jgi:hypothetical protein